MEGEDTYWQMGLAVAPEISLRTLSAEKTPVGNRFTQFAAPPLLVAEAVIRSSFLFFSVLMAEFSESRCTELGAIRVFGDGFEGKEINATVATVRCV